MQVQIQALAPMAGSHVFHLSPFTVDSPYKEAPLFSLKGGQMYLPVPNSAKGMLPFQRTRVRGIECQLVSRTAGVCVCVCETRLLLWRVSRGCPRASLPFRVRLVLTQSIVHSHCHCPQFLFWISFSVGPTWINRPDALGQVPL